MTKKYSPLQSCGYGWSDMNPVKFASEMKRANKLFKKLREDYDFEAIAFSGSSGCAAAFYLAALHEIPLIYVRKDNEECHGNSLECNIGYEGTIKKYLIVDDFISTGTTVRRISEKITRTAQGRNAYPAKCIGILCYDSSCHHDVNIKIGSRKVPIFATGSSE
jgi:orotate phosphoribosyltransferase